LGNIGRKRFTFALAPPRQKFKKVKAFLRFFYFFSKTKKSAILVFCGFLVFSVFHVEQFSVNFDYQEKLNDNHYHWANGSDYFHLHFKADKLRLVF
jgi:hypothetical protein